MENIPLRTYLREIDYLIQEKKTILAFNKCAHVLSTFPNNINALEQLGKILLDLGELPISEKVFSLILDVIPDDLSALIGLSCVSENRNNPENAAFFMERAFEHQPSNKMLQDELKRLRSLRDGTEYLKIKLTRGALIKLYLRSKMFSQAISEIQLGLAESPNRKDFKLQLAIAHFESGQFIESFELALDLLKELPYCLEANKICFEYLINQNEIESANSYKKILSKLDPYYEYFLARNDSINEIPDISVTIAMDEVSNQSLVDFDVEEYLEKSWGHDRIEINKLPLNIDKSKQTDEDKFSFEEIPDLHIDPLPLPDWALGEEYKQNNEKSDDIKTNFETLQTNDNEDLMPIDSDVPANPDFIPIDSWQKIPDISTIDTNKVSDTELIIIDSGQVNVIIDSLKKALHDNDIDVVLKITSLLLNSRTDQELIYSELDNSVELYPTLTEPWVNYAAKLLKMGNTERAFNIFKKIQQKIQL